MLTQQAHQINLVDRIYSTQLFSKEASKALELRGELTKSDLAVLLRHLARDKKAVVYDNEVKNEEPTTKTLLKYLAGCKIWGPR